MAREPFTNVGLVCDKHASKPGGFKGQEPENFLGKYVKLGFPAINPITRKSSTEHMWVEVICVDKKDRRLKNGEQMVGKVSNNPVFDCEYSCGDEVAFSVDEIEAVYSGD